MQGLFISNLDFHLLLLQLYQFYWVCALIWNKYCKSWFSLTIHTCPRLDTGIGVAKPLIVFRAGNKLYPLQSCVGILYNFIYAGQDKNLFRSKSHGTDSVACTINIHRYPSKVKALVLVKKHRLQAVAFLSPTFPPLLNQVSYGLESELLLPQF